MPSTKKNITVRETGLRVVIVTKAIPGVVDVGDYLLENPKHPEHWIRIPKSSIENGVEDLDLGVPKAKA